mmetsp:Transcript_10567/g.30106  ORF Transcript_10567/g.30106 Transcript_10567/m.30106 type:complete len:462 (-) Transcript_10567:187-1572(-)
MPLQYLRQNAVTVLLSLGLVAVCVFWGSTHPHTLRLSTTTPAVFMKTTHRHPDPSTYTAPGSLATEWYTWIWHCNSSWRYAHMSMLASLPGDRVMAAWQASRDHEGQAMAGLQLVQALWTAVSPDGGHTWTPPVVAVQGVSPSWGPVLHLDDASSRLWLFYSFSTQANSAGGDLVYRTTKDLDSANPRWSPPTVLLRSEDMDGFPKVTANRLEVLSNGDWLLPIWQEVPPDVGISSVLIGRANSASQDGRLWEVEGHLTDPGAGWLIEGTLAEVTPADTNRPFVLQLFRTTDKQVWSSKSSDGGRSWLAPQPVPALKNPNSKVAMSRVVDRNGKQGLVLAYNPSEDARSPLVLAYSVDGFSWTIFARLEDASRVPGRWYAYPTVVQHGGLLYCSYTVYDHLTPGDVMGTVRYSHRADFCPGGVRTCQEEQVEAGRQPVVVKRQLRNVFVGIRLAVLPPPEF